jgi:uncharacterized protein
MSQSVYSVSLAEARQKGRLEASFAVSGDHMSPECRGLVRDLRLSCDVSYVGEEKFYCQIRLHGTGVLACSRCLEPILRPWEQRFAAMLVPERAAGADHEPASHHLDGEASEVSYAPNRAFDLLPMAEEGIVLSVPMKPLCSEQCRGLCPECGVNRNLQDCRCAHADGDSRMAPLAALKDKLRTS